AGGLRARQGRRRPAQGSTRRRPERAELREGFLDALVAVALSGVPWYASEYMSNRSHIQVRERLLADASASALAETFKVLGDVTRVRILDALSRAEVAVCDLAELLGVTQSAVSHQLRLLRHARLVKSRRDGQHIYYTLDDHHILRLFEQGLEHVEERK